jgi:hypothetical protein
MGALQKQFSLYFKAVDVSKVEWVTSPFAPNNVSGLTTCEEEQPIDISCDDPLKAV